MKTQQKLFFLLGSALMVSSCSTDPAYDSLTEEDGIDMSMTIGKGLALPFGSTDKIYLTELLDPEKVELLEKDGNGLFYLSKEDRIDPFSYKIDPITFSLKPEIESKSIKLVVDQNILPQEIKDILKLVNDNPSASAIVNQYNGKKLSELGGLVPQSITIKVTSDGLDFGQNAQFDLKVDNVDEALIEVGNIDFKAPVALRIELKAENLPGQSGHNSLDMGQLALNLPKFLTLTTTSGEAVADNSNITLQGLKLDKAAGKQDASVAIEYIVSGMNFGAEPLRNVNRHLELNDKFTIDGTISTDEFTVDAKDLVFRFEDNVMKVELINEITISPVVTEMNLEVAKVVGKFDKKIDDSNSSIDINFSDDMQFLKEQGVEIDLKNPSLKLNLTNDTPIYADVKLKGSNDKAATFEHIDLYAPEGKEIELSMATYPTSGINAFLSPIPDHLDINVHPYTDSSQDMELSIGEEHVIEGSYAFRAPLEFNKINFCYEKKIEDIWGENRGDVTDKLSSLTNAVLQADIVNALPIDLEISVAGTNYNTGKEDSSIVTCEVSPISKGSIANPATTTVSIKLSINDTANLGDLIIKVTGKGADCEFNANQYIQLQNASISLSDGVNVTLD